MTPISLEAMAASVPDGALVALPPDNSLPSVALAKALIRRDKSQPGLSPSQRAELFRLARCLVALNMSEAKRRLTTDSGLGCKQAKDPAQENL